MMLGLMKKQKHFPNQTLLRNSNTSYNETTTVVSTLVLKYFYTLAALWDSELRESFRWVSVKSKGKKQAIGSKFAEKYFWLHVRV